MAVQVIESLSMTRLPLERGRRIRALRNAVGYTQVEAGARIGIPVAESRVYFGNLETGKNQAKKLRDLANLAQVFALETEIVDDYLSGKLELNTVLELRKKTQAQPPTPTIQTPNTAITPLEQALARVFVPGEHELVDTDSLRAAFAEIGPMLQEETNLLELCKLYLDAAKELRLQGIKPTSGAIGLRAVTNARRKITENAK